MRLEPADGRGGGGPKQTPGAGTSPAAVEVVGNGWTVGEFLKFRRIHARTNAKEDVDNSMSFKQAVLDSPGSICCFILSTSASQEPSLSDGESAGMPGPCPSGASAPEGVMPPAPGCPWHSWAVGGHTLSHTGLLQPTLHTGAERSVLSLRHSLCCLALFFLHYLYFGGRRHLYTTAIVVQLLSGVRLCDPTDCSTPGFPVPHRPLEFAQAHVHWVGDGIQPSVLCCLLAHRKKITDWL